VAVKRRLKLGKAKAKAERKVHCTSILTELPQKCTKSSRRATPQWKLRQRRQPTWQSYAR